MKSQSGSERLSSLTFPNDSVVNQIFPLLPSSDMLIGEQLLQAGTVFSAHERLTWQGDVISKDRRGDGCIVE